MGLINHENVSNQELSGGQKTGIVIKGFLISFILALFVAFFGALFEAVILWPVFNFVTFTLGPDILFLILNTVLIKKYMENWYIKLGAKIGYINVVVVAVGSFISFLLLVQFFNIDFLRNMGF